MIIVNFDKNELCKKAYGLWQYDYGQVLRIQGLNLPTAAEIHFALQETGGETVTRIGITKDGVTDVTIPDSLLEADGASQDYQIYVFIYLASPESGETTRRITLGVKSRPRPEAFNTPGEGELFEEAIQAVNDAAKRAEDAGKEASAAAGEARESASLAGKHLTDTQVLAEQVEINADAVAQGTETARDLLAQTQEAASDAALSAETAKQSETAAREAQTAAETAEDAARQYVAETEADRKEVAESKQSVEQMQSNVARIQTDVQADKEAVEQTVSEFGTAAQNALTAIGQAQNTAVSAVQTEGQKQATAVQETGTQAVSEVDVAKTAAVEAVTVEGDVQVGRVEDAAAEIVANREQIQQNKTNIATLTNKTNTLAPGIVLGTKGGAIAVHNASEQPLVGLNVYGKSEQVQTTGKNLFDVSKIDDVLEGSLSIKNNNGILIVTTNANNGAVNTRKTLKELCPGLINGSSYTLSAESTGSQKHIYLSNGGSWIFNASTTITQEKLDSLVYFYASGVSTTATIKNIQIELGDKATAYEPYTGGKPSPSTEYPQDIVNVGNAGEINVNVLGKNLIPFPYKENSKVENGVTITVNDDGTITYNGTSTKSVNFKVFQGKFPLLEGATYHYKDVNVQLNGVSNADFSSPFVAKKGDYISLMWIWKSAGNSFNNVTLKPQLELGSTATAYEPYKPAQTLTLSTPGGLAGIPVKSDGNYVDETGQQWMCDEIDLNRGIKLQRCWKGFVGGNRQWSLYSSYKGFYLADVLPEKMNYGEGYCDKFIVTDKKNLNNPNIIRFGAGNKGIYCMGNPFYDDSLEDKGVSNWDKYLSENPLEIVTYLSTPIETPLTPEEIAAYKSLHTYSPNTTIVNDTDCGMSVEYVADTKAYIQSVEDKITAIQAALINQNISGGGITIDDAAELPISDLQIFGRSEQVKTTGAQLLNLKNGTYTINGVTAEIKDGELKLSGTATANGGRTIRLSEPFLLRQGTYIGTSVKSAECILSKTLDDSYVATISSGKSFTINEDTEVYFGINVHETKAYNESIFIMLNAGETLKPWEPYTGGKPSPSLEYPQEITSAGDKGTLEVKIADSGEKSQRFIIQTPNGLAGIPVATGGNYTDENGQQWMRDEINCEKQERIQRIGECVFDGSEDWFADYISNQVTKRYRTRIPDIIHKKQPDEALCSHFSFVGYGDDRIGFIQTNNNTDFYLKTMFETVDELKKWLSNNNVTVKYILKTPICTPLAPKEIAAYKSLHTYSGTTLIANDSGAGMSLTYTADTKKYVDKKIAAISAAMIGG